MFRIRGLVLAAITTAVVATSLSADTFRQLQRTEPFDVWRTMYMNQNQGPLPRPNGTFDATVERNTSGRVVIRNDFGTRLAIVNPTIPVVHQGVEHPVSTLQRGDRIRISFDEDRKARRIDVVRREKP